MGHSDWRCYTDPLKSTEPRFALENESGFRRSGRPLVRAQGLCIRVPGFDSRPVHVWQVGGVAKRTGPSSGAPC
jgi:hypothetical protein